MRRESRGPGIRPPDRTSERRVGDVERRVQDRQPSRTSSAVTLHGGTTWMRLKLANGSSPPALHAAITASIAGLEPP